ncbi:COASY [Bugula neritina]|uniref:Bifunctional coenzyme A synthase n=1 Tax=Bugula neritina TaxID=10212 RepID=A0A7J7JS47_BUGNE|nr:COASY [Bugula neritina]
MSSKSVLMCLDVSASRFSANVLSALKNVSTYKNVEKQVFVHMYSATPTSTSTSSSTSGSTTTAFSSGLFSTRPYLKKLLQCTSHVYNSASKHAPLLNFTVLQRYSPQQPQRLEGDVNLLLVDVHHMDPLVDAAKQYFGLSPDVQVISCHADETTPNDSLEALFQDLDPQTYDYCALGGTFDSIHNGHKVLLGAAIALTNKSLTIGVTDQAMNQRKTLHELITLIEDRKAAVREFVEQVRPEIEYEVVTLRDVYGPTVTDEKLQCIVVSEETKKGADMINQQRVGRGFSPMAKFCIPLVADDSHDAHQDAKVSSSSIREQKLGRLLRQPEPRSNLPARPYLIGLTGGIASGKSSVGKRLEALGAGLISSDLLAHKAYMKGSEAYHEIVKTFGEDIVNPESGEIERRKLGTIVFSDKSKLDQLNGIVWPATAKLVQQKIGELYQQGKEVCFIEAALLLEANWSSQLHEVWSCVIPEKEAVLRLHARDGLGEEEALKRIRSQSSNEYRVDNSNVVLCTLWDYQVTQQQVETAWKLLQERLKQFTTKQT